MARPPRKTPPPEPSAPRAGERPQVWNGVPVPYEASLDELRKLIGGSESEAWAAFIALSFRDDDESLALLAELSAGPDAFRRRAAVEAIGRHPRGSKRAELIRARLDDPSGYVVRAALDAAAALGLKAARARVVELALEGERLTRVTAMRALEGLFDDSLFETLLERSREDQDAGVRKQAAMTLRANADEAHWRELVEAWRDDDVPRHRAWACELLGRFGTHEDLGELDDFMEDADSQVRSAARRAARALGEEE